MGRSAGVRHAYYVAHREEAKAKASAWYATHREEAKANHAAYYAVNREEAKAYLVRWNAANPEKAKASAASRHAAYRAAHPEKRAATHAAYYAAHRAERAATHAAWAKANPATVNVITAARRARKLGAPGAATVAEIAARWTYYGDKCWICGGVATATDHVKPLVKGGSNWPANLRPACGPCNSSKGATWPLMAAQSIGGPLAINS